MARQSPLAPSSLVCVRLLIDAPVHVLCCLWYIVRCLFKLESPP